MSCLYEQDCPKSYELSPYLPANFILTFNCPGGPLENARVTLRCLDPYREFALELPIPHFQTLARTARQLEHHLCRLHPGKEPSTNPGRPSIKTISVSVPARNP